VPAHERCSGSTSELLRDAPFVRFLSGILIHVAVPFFIPCIVHILKASHTEIGIFATVNTIGSVFGQIIADPLAGHVGADRMLRWSMVVIPTLPIMWAFTSAHWHAAIPNFIAGIA
jgi:MFS family permease